jgi:DNA-damage-inducible protein D
MKTELIQSLTANFESYAKQAENGVEFWLARDIQSLLGYEKWYNFKTVILKAKTACEVSGHKVLDHSFGSNVFGRKHLAPSKRNS